MIQWEDMVNRGHFPYFSKFIFKKLSKPIKKDPATTRK